MLGVGIVGSIKLFRETISRSCTSLHCCCQLDSCFRYHSSQIASLQFCMAFSGIESPCVALRCWRWVVIFYSLYRYFRLL